METFWYRLSQVQLGQSEKLDDDVKCLYVRCAVTHQVRYDFGLRSIVQLLRALGSMKSATSTDESEQTLVLRAVRELHLAQLVGRDEPLFLSFVNDLFPGIILAKTCQPGMEEALAKELEAAGLMNHSPWTFKLTQVLLLQ